MYRLIRYLSVRILQCSFFKVLECCKLVRVHSPFYYLNGLTFLKVYISQTNECPSQSLEVPRIQDLLGRDSEKNFLLKLVDYYLRIPIGRLFQ
jgi:hypothetical protein